LTESGILTRQDYIAHHGKFTASTKLKKMKGNVTLSVEGRMNKFNIVHYSIAIYCSNDRFLALSHSIPVV
jgi:hypothetical protein